MTPPSAMDLLFQPLISAVQLIVAMALFCLHQPRRNRFALRVGFVVVGYLVATVIATYIGFVWEPRLMGEWSFTTQIVLFIFITFVWVALVHFCFDVPKQSAVFLAVAGFSMYHTATGLIGSIIVVAGGAGVLEDVESAAIAVFPLEFDQFIFMLNTIVTVAVYALCYRLFARKLTGEWVSKPDDRTIAVFFLSVIFIDVIFDFSMMSTYNYGLPVFQRTVFGLTKTFICFFLLYVEFQILLVERLQADVELSGRLLAERERQYQISRETIDAINIKCHDIRHQIRHLKDGSEGAIADASVLADIAREVAIYDATVKTGNDALDTILTEKRLLCERDGITLSCIADGAALDFMQPVEIYALFGNILDNAIEAVSAISDREKRSISFVVQRRGDMVSIHVENYFSGSVSFDNGLPKTTKVDTANHGFGMRSIRATVEEHDGSLTLGAEGGIFRLDALIPIP